MNILPCVISVILSSAVPQAKDPDWLKRPSCEPIPVSAKELYSGRMDFKFVCITGTVQDVFHDENDSRFRFFIINADDETVYAPTKTIKESDETLDALIGAKVAVCGTCDRTNLDNIWRRQFRRELYVWDFRDIAVLEPAPASPFGVAALGDLTNVRPSDVPRLGRRRVTGKVLAAWQDNRALLKTPDGALIRIETKDGTIPAAGTFVEAAGLPESDIYRVNLTRAVYRTSDPFPCTEAPVTNVTAETILTDHFGKPGIKPEFHGRTVRLTGIVRNLPHDTIKRLFIQDGRHLVPVDLSAAPDAADNLQIGSTVSVTGVCITEIEAWRPSSVFPRATGILIVLRAPNDLTVLSTPPWWTPAKLLPVIGALTLLLVGVLIWNRSLRILAERRGRTLLREQIGRVKNRLKVGERTRLAVELHDSLSQSLTGIAFEIKAARNLAKDDPAASDRHLSLAARTLLFCRNELRNCLWELRTQALEATSMDDAIRQTLQPHIGTAKLNVRFNVPRHRISDNTAHALLRIIRELASNAVRHGHATELRIAGVLEDERLDFSVTDNGTGFDPDCRPGVKDGHFGLQGVRERVASQGGSVNIDSHPGSGTRVSVSLTVSSPEEEEKEAE